MTTNFSLFQRVLVASSVSLFSTFATAASYTKYNCEVTVNESIVVRAVKFRVGPNLPVVDLDTCDRGIPADRIVEVLEFNPQLQNRPNTPIRCLSAYSPNASSNVGVAVYVAPRVTHPIQTKSFSLECAGSDVVSGVCFPRGGGFSPFLSFTSLDRERSISQMTVVTVPTRTPANSLQFRFSLQASPYMHTGNLPGASTTLNVGQPIELSITLDQGNDYYRGLSSVQAKCSPETVNP